MSKFRYILPVAIAALTACGTSQNGSNSNSGDSLSNNNKIEANTVSPKDISKETKSYTADSNGFAMTLFAHVCNSSPEENLCISPASAQWALSMVANGAEKNTLKEMLTALNSESIASLNSRERGLIERLMTGNEKTRLSIANSIWINSKLPVKPEFIEKNKDLYDAEVGTMQFNAEAVKAINNWCSQKTEGKIPQIINQLNNDMMMVLLNAIYFKGGWIKPFNEDATKECTFTKEDGSEIMVQMMSQRFRTGYYGNNDVQIVSKPFNDGRFEMIFVLPREGMKLTEAINLLGKNYTAWRSEIRQGEDVIFGLPRFKVEYSTSLRKSLEAMGMKDAFGKDADFNGISTSPMYIDDVIQKSFINVNEEGVEAAAVTAAVMVGMSLQPQQPREVKLDRPFIYMIAERGNDGNILFVGKSGAPRE